MPEPDPAKVRTFASAKKLRQWLKANHASENELWIKVFKVKTGKPSVSWTEIAVETLCWGWIDGVKKSIDGEAYLQRITPRKPRSSWSKRNREHVERLMSEGRMQEPGLVQVRAAKADGRWKNAYAASEMKVPADFLAAVERKPKAKPRHAHPRRAADFVGDNRVIFNIGGNKYRLVVHMSYRRQIAFIKFIGTHKQYDRIDAATVGRGPSGRSPIAPLPRLPRSKEIQTGEDGDPSIRMTRSLSGLNPCWRPPGVLTQGRCSLPDRLSALPVAHLYSHWFRRREACNLGTWFSQGGKSTHEKKDHQHQFGSLQPRL